MLTINFIKKDSFKEFKYLHVKIYIYLDLEISNKYYLCPYGDIKPS